MNFPLSDLYAAMGTACTYTPAGGGAGSQIKAVLDSRPADVLGGEQISTRYEVRLTAADVGGKVARGARFQFGSVIYETTAYAQPLDDGAELVAPVKVV